MKWVILGLRFPVEPHFRVPESLHVLLPRFCFMLEIIPVILTSGKQVLVRKADPALWVRTGSSLLKNVQYSLPVLKALWLVELPQIEGMSRHQVHLEGLCIARGTHLPSGVLMQPIWGPKNFRVLRAAAAGPGSTLWEPLASTLWSHGKRGVHG